MKATKISILRDFLNVNNTDAKIVSDFISALKLHSKNFFEKSRGAVAVLQVLLIQASLKCIKAHAKYVTS